MTADAEGRDPLMDVIAHDCGGLVTGYVVVATWLDGDGDSRLYVNSMENQRNHTTLGLITWADAVERARAVDTWHEDQEEP